MTVQDELIEELDAFDPKWKEHYRTLVEATSAAGRQARTLYDAWYQSEFADYHTAEVEGVFDYKTAIEDQQRAEEESSLPFKLKNIGSVPGGQG